MSFVYPIVYVSTADIGSDFFEQLGFFTDYSNSPKFFELELSVNPIVFKNLGEAGLNVGYGRDVELAIATISNLGITLCMEKFLPNKEENAKAYIFIPMHNVISISNMSSDSKSLRAWAK